MKREKDLPPDKHDLSTSGADYVAGYWIITPIPPVTEPSRIGAALAHLLKIVPQPKLPALLVVPFLAGAVVFLGLVLSSGWGFTLTP